MTVVALVSAKSCGVTTSALAMTLAAPRSALLAECDPAGGTIRTGFLVGHGTTALIGLHRLALAERAGRLGEEFDRHIVPLVEPDGGVQRLLLPGLTDPSQATGLAGTWQQLVPLWTVLERAGIDVVIDAGRVLVESAGSLNATRYPAPLLRRADVVLLVVRRNLTSVVAAAPVVKTLRQDLAEHGTGGDALGLLVIDEARAPSNTELAQRLGAPVFGQLPIDWDTAGALTHGPTGRGIAPRAELLRHARSCFEQVNAHANRRRLQLAPQFQGVMGRG